MSKFVTEEVKKKVENFTERVIDKMDNDFAKAIVYGIHKIVLWSTVVILGLAFGSQALLFLFGLIV